MESDFQPGQVVEYVAHRVAWQDNGIPLTVGDEDWRRAAVVDVFEHPPHHGEEHRWIPASMTEHHLGAGTVDVVVRLQPEDDSPPLDLNAKLVRSV